MKLDLSSEPIVIDFPVPVAPTIRVCLLFTSRFFSNHEIRILSTVGTITSVYEPPD